MTVLTVSAGTAGVSIKDDVMTFDVDPIGAGINIKSNEYLVDVWIVTGTATGEICDPICNVQWGPYVSGTSGLQGEWIAYNEGIELTAWDKTIGIWYSRQIDLINTDVGSTPTPVSFFPNTSGTTHFIDYTFTVPTTGYYSLDFITELFLYVESLTIVTSYEVLFDYRLIMVIGGHRFYTQGTGYWHNSNPATSDSLIWNVPRIFLTAGVHYTVSFILRTLMLKDEYTATGLPGDWTFRLYFGLSPSNIYYFKIDGVL
jgi:hypothetical protein